MNYQNSFPSGQPVRDLQYMLDILSTRYPSLPAVLPDGIFGERTLEAVMLFQRDFFPPVTGVVDSGTWNAILAKYRETQFQSGPPDLLSVFPHGQFTIEEGDAPGQLRLIQTMFSDLARVLSNFQPDTGDGSHTGTTVENTRTLQRIAGLPETGAIDRATWAFLARLDHLFVTRPSADRQ